jgi:hypothetical protein
MGSRNSYSYRNNSKSGKLVKKQRNPALILVGRDESAVRIEHVEGFGGETFGAEGGAFIDAGFLMMNLFLLAAAVFL